MGLYCAQVVAPFVVKVRKKSEGIILIGKGKYHMQEFMLNEHVISVLYNNSEGNDICTIGCILIVCCALCCMHVRISCNIELKKHAYIYYILESFYK